MEKLRIKNKDLYKIEVNDNGEYIQFDLNDIGLKIKLHEALEKIEKISKEVQEKMKAVKTKKEMDYLEQEMFGKMRKAMDTFLGENACQKIFGNRNYYEMFDDLIREFSRKRPELKGKSHFDMLNFNAENIRKRVMKKYNKKQKYVI